MTYRSYRKWFRCGDCRTRRATGTALFAHLLQHPECAPCRCSGYHHPHRRGSPCCEHNPWHPLHQARRAGTSQDDLEDIAMDLRLQGVGGKLMTEWPYD